MKTKDYVVIGLLVVIALLLLWNRPGRYAISGSSSREFWVLDTRTGKAWKRLPGAVVYLGTNDKAVKVDKIMTELRRQMNEGQ